MAFRNKIRLRLMIGKAQFPDDRNVFRLADGTKKVQSIVIHKTYQGVTDYYPEWVHQRLKIALSHDTVNIESDKYLGGVSVDGDYEIDWVDFKDYPYAQANFKLEVTPFDFTNSNCQTCDEASQLMLVDDHFTSELDQSTEYTIDVFANDTINCSPITATITYINAIFVASAEIDETTGIITLTTRPLFFQRNTEKLLTYRVTCSNGGFDEADVYADLVGDLASCLAPTDVVLSDKTDRTASFTWVEPDPVPASGYEWKLVTDNSPAVTIETGTTSGTSISLPTDPDLNLEPFTAYIFSIRAVCGVDDVSQWVNVSFTTEPLEQECGRYVVYSFGEQPQENSNKPRRITYIGCDSSMQTIMLKPFAGRIICAAQNGPNDPVSIIGADQITYNPSPC
jgi:hypothetical protein